MKPRRQTPSLTRQESEIQMKIFLEAAEKNGFELETPLEKKLGNLLSVKLKGAKL